MYDQYDVSEDDWIGAKHRSMTRISSVEDLELNEGNVWLEPFIIDACVLRNDEFVNIPRGVDRVFYISERLADTSITVANDSKMKFREWFTNHRLQPDMYLRDLHVNRSVNGFKLFNTPVIFPDWLSEYYANHQPDQSRPVLDFQFLYWGSKGSKTPFHRDVIGTFSWSHNLHGRKKWKFFLSGNEVIECVQNVGETVFVPSQCYHVVENEAEDTISVNQNWINEHNIHLVAQQLAEDSDKVREDLIAFGGYEDTDELAESIENIVWANNALNLSNLLRIIEFAIRRRLQQGISPTARKNIQIALECIQKRYPNHELYAHIKKQLE